MKAIHVVFPVLRGTRRFFIEKGRRWSVIEHLLLDIVARTPSSTTRLSAKSGLPRRVIVEAFIRLMRAGWVEIVATPDGPVFKATALARQRRHWTSFPRRPSLSRAGGASPLSRSQAASSAAGSWMSGHKAGFRSRRMTRSCCTCKDPRCIQRAT
jgi:hypothetical protein